MAMIRRSLGVSQEWVAKGIVSRSHYSNIENGRYMPAPDVLELIAKKLNVPDKYLIEHNVPDRKLCR
ncbi:helix-turn-helix domain-containing protein [Caldalkalibacillus thermarum]